MLKLTLLAMAVILLFGSNVAISQENPTTEQVLGAIAGGALGNTIGAGDGRKAATVIGAVIGYKYGNKILGGKENFSYNTPYTTTTYPVYNDNLIRNECRKSVPITYEYDYTLKQAYLNGCIKRTKEQILAEKQHNYLKRRELERRAFEEGYENYVSP